MLRVEPGAGTRRFTVFIDNNIPLKQITEAEDAAFASYAPVTVPLDAYPGTHTIKLHGQSTVPMMNQPHARFQVDNVSIQVPDPPADPTPTPTRIRRRHRILIRPPSRRSRCARARWRPSSEATRVNCWTERRRLT